MTDFLAEHALLQEHILQARSRGRVVHVRGWGSKDFYRKVVDSEHAEVLSTSGLDGVVNYEPTELFIQVAAGTSLKSVEALLASHGQCLPFEPPRFKYHSPQDENARDATIGGMVASGLSGPSRASVGAVKDFILGAHLINGKAEHLVFGGQVMKNVAGYDVSRVLSSSMGTLGVITQVTLKVLPLAPGDLSVRALMSAQEAQALMLLLGRAPLPLRASTWTRVLIEPTSPQSATPKFELTLRLNGASAATQSAKRLIQSELEALGCETQVLRAEEATLHWESVRDQEHPFFLTPPSPEASLWRVSLPLKALQHQVPTFSDRAMVEWFGALHWVWAKPMELSSLQEEVSRLGGTLSLWRALQGDPEGQLKAFNTPIEPHLHQLQQQLQVAFDPHGVFNTGRAYP